MDRDALVTDYLSIRATSQSLSNRLLEFLSKEDMVAAAERLGMLRNQTVFIGGDADLAVLHDYAIHEIFRDGENAVDRMLRQAPPPEGSDEMVVLRAIRASHYSLFQVESLSPGFGLICFDTSNSGRIPIQIIDVNLSSTAKAGLAIAGRLYAPRSEWSMTSGALIPITRDAGNLIADALGNFRRRGIVPTHAQMTQVIIRNGLAAGALDAINSGSFDGQDESDAWSKPVVRAGARVGRNDPCSCGSGKKYKKCCGS